VLLFSVVFGLALLGIGSRADGLVSVIEMTSDALFGAVGIVMRLAPIGACGAMAFTVGRYGLGSLLALGKLMAGVYITCLLFVFVVLGAIASATGFSLSPNTPSLGNDCWSRTTGMGSSNRFIEWPTDQEKLRQEASCAAAGAAAQKARTQAVSRACILAS